VGKDEQQNSLNPINSVSKILINLALEDSSPKTEHLDLY